MFGRPFRFVQRFPKRESGELLRLYAHHLSAGDVETWNGIFRVFRYLAYLYTYPGSRLSWMTVLIGAKQGSGKSTLMRAIPEAMFGHGNVRPVDVREIVSDFSGYMSGCQILCTEEIYLGGYRDAVKLANQMKGLISEDRVVTVGKSKDGRVITNTATFFGTSNYMDAVIVDEHDRRNDIILTNAEKMPDDLSIPLYELIKNHPDELTELVLRFGKYGAGVRPNAPPPESKAKRTVRDAGKAPWVIELRDRYEAGIWPFNGDCVALEDVMLLLHAKHFPPPSSKAVLHELRVMFPDAFPTELAQKRFPAPIGKKQARVLIFRNKQQWKDRGPSALYEHYEGMVIKGRLGFT
jgi:hypothetical protein